MQAINAFLQSMNLTYGQLQARPALVDSLLSYHIVPRVQLSGAQLKAGAPPRVARSVNPAYVLRFGRAASGAISVTDVQNRTAAVVGPARSAGKHTAYSIDRVLLNGARMRDSSGQLDSRTARMRLPCSLRSPARAIRAVRNAHAQATCSPAPLRSSHTTSASAASRRCWSAPASPRRWRRPPPT